MRGKDGCVRDAVDSRGITLAYAGKRTPCRNTSLRYWDHPRICGEKTGGEVIHFSPVGSPPHMRGKAVLPLSKLADMRITPAYAGKRRREDGVTFRLEDHPRICGEKIAAQPWAKRRLGSPPHMRGKAREARNIWRLRWITPAYAGKRHDELGRRLEGQDHPRVCGEKPSQRVRISRSSGITPAYAGKSMRGPRSALPS